MLFLLLAALANVWIITAVFTPPQEWIDNIEKSCKKKVNPDTMALKSLDDSGVVCLFFGAYFGLLLQAKYSTYFACEPEKW